MHRSLLALYSASAFIFFIGCESPPSSPEPDPKQFDEALLSAAKEYENWGAVYPNIHVAPMFCAAPPSFPASPRLSASADMDTHGKKVYMLFAKKRDDYLDLRQSKAAPVGQILVKESWVSEIVTKNAADAQATHGKIPLLTKDGITYRAGNKASLFIMMKMAPETAGTDEGWVYGTLSADGRTVTSSGKVESCMNCHQRTPLDRQFGLSESK